MNNLNHQLSLISLNFQSWTPDHTEESFSKNLIDQFDRRMNQDLHSNHALSQSDLDMSETTFEEEDENDDDEQTVPSISSTSRYSNDINRSSTSSSSYKIREHERPSTSAAAVVAAARAASKNSSLADSYSSSIHQQQLQKTRNILKKSSMYFAEKMMKKKKSTMFTNSSEAKTLNRYESKQNLDQKKRPSPGITIKSPIILQQPFSANTPWWRRLNNYFAT
ncbi:hypothetical protein [Parasitella parasitica]|uniref:Uncharacterized protein n=1 Tax=Parasitella parasitica TaxID=35722 RepID=A0A0B7MUF1_9FUNG|nr:hypothetical protein [Parasitella parasitica]